MSLAIVDNYPNKEFVTVFENQVPNKSAKIGEYLRITVSRNQFKKLLFESCAGCRKMAALPQAAFAASKVRCNQKRDNNMISAIEGKEKAGKEYTYNGRFYLKGWELTPLKYNSKLMNSIWGLYNRYSVHNFKKNTDADEGLLATVWKRVYSNPSSVMSASVVSASTTMKTPLPGGGI
ncbi:hypothetical protein KPH14_006096 [Odynerus spinipes]|uniref:Uncharacterized protein n=1 Tax=Odynerus spinipes TaxID=1348599 RepID=A0AAD9RK25_9HYME|nr:hypothetical protein KPH14_006096 [Odynerus spinipes]